MNVEVITNLPFPLKKQEGQTVGFIPTMGYLHDGHMSLVRRAKSECDIVVLSIFVNPLQFGPNEDFAKYPRDAERDLAMAKAAGVDYVFMPDSTVMYPRKQLTTVSVAELTKRLCGASRPGHFDGVTTVVLKLFNIVRPDRAYFGMKDAQQIAVIQRMVEDLNVPVTIVPCPILREASGLAMSSRNVYLSPEERTQALVLSESLTQVAEWVKQPNLTAAGLKDRILAHIHTAPLAEVDYVEISSFPELAEIQPQTMMREALDCSKVLVALAVRFGNTRLIDNTMLE